MTTQLSLGYSPCPNDTFIFYALTHGHIPLHNLQLSVPVLDDVETLNTWALSAKLDITKLSFHALGHVRDSYSMLSSGAALGRGCGPLLVARNGSGPGKSDPSKWTIAVPGRYTTAALLLKLFLPTHEQKVFMRFDAVMRAVADGKVDGGVIIHESRFTYQEYGLSCVQDLGVWWEQETGLPIPLGCIAARKSFDQQVFQEISAAVSASIGWAKAHPEKCSAYIKDHARELDDKVIAGHVDLYVNDFSIDIGDEGRAAVKELFARGREAGAFANAAQGGL
ncbi:MAG: 1,4-dihydroxy-6-naphthoate synthase [Desulfobulbus sp.]|nr:MAG: 1,4-dihydroxy-6-naphthoate synthase [Desulfobulbus sp.]